MTALNRPEIGSPDWVKSVTASKVPAILGLSPWRSPYSLWMQMSGRIDATPETTTTRRGHYLEPAILDWWEDAHQGRVALTDLWVSTIPWGGATLDGLAYTDDLDMCVIVEAKSAAYRDGWGAPGTDEIPEHYKAQVLWQLAMCPEAERAYVAVLFGQGLEFAEYVVERDPATEEALVRICAEFHASLDAEMPPPLDDTVATYETMRRLHPGIDGTDVAIPKTLARRYVRAQASAKKAEARARARKTEVLARMGDARTASWDGITVARRQPGRGDHINLIQTAKEI